MLTLFVQPVYAEWSHLDFDLALKASIFVKHLGCSKLTEKHNLCRFLLSSFFFLNFSFFADWASFQTALEAWCCFQLSVDIIHLDLIYHLSQKWKSVG